MNGDRSAPELGARHLLGPGRLGPYTLANRLVMAPMTRNRATREGVPTASNVIYYAQRASAGLLITEATAVSHRGVGYPFIPGIFSGEQIAGWRSVVNAVHRLGSRIFLQLFHAGRISHPSLQPGAGLPVAPSAISPGGQVHTYDGPRPFVTPRALEHFEIRQVIDEFRTAASNALLAGFDGIEIHGANGYLVDQFLRDGSNRRTDEYGGSISNRVRFAVDVARAVADIWGEDRVGIRISPLGSFNSMSDSRPATTFAALVTALRDLNLAYLHVVEEDNTPQSGPRFDLDLLRQLWSGTYIVNGNYDQDRAETIIARGSADFVSFGRLFLANPDLPLRLEQRATLNEPDPATFYGGSDQGYIDYPFLAEPTRAVRQVIVSAGGHHAHVSVAEDSDASRTPTLTMQR